MHWNNFTPLILITYLLYHDNVKSNDADVSLLLSDICLTYILMSRWPK